MSDERAAEIILERIKKEESLEIDTMSVSEINALKKAYMSLMHRVSPLTNYDRLVSKTPEELADYFSELTCFPGANRDICKGVANCMDCWLNWLRQEAKE